MNPYKESEAFSRLNKLAELEKRILGNIEDAKDGDNGEFIPESIREDLRLRGSCPIPKEVLDETIDDGLSTTISHMHKHRAMMMPGEALYHAIGKKDRSIYNDAINMSLSDILKMVTNRAAVSQTQPDEPMNIEDFDEPKHIRIIVKLRGTSPDLLSKNANYKLKTEGMVRGLELMYMNGRKEVVGADYVNSHKSNIEMFVNDGVIIKIIKLMSSNMKTTIYDKTASSDIDDAMMLDFIKGMHS